MRANAFVSRVLVSCLAFLSLQIDSAHALPPPLITEAEFQQQMSVLKPDPALETAARAIYDDYRSQRTGADNARKVLLSWSSGLNLMEFDAWDQDYLVARNAAFDRKQSAWEAAAKTLDDWYFQSLKGLDPAQQLEVEALQRAHFRSWMLRRDQGNPEAPIGFSADLIEIVRQVHVNCEKAEIKQILADYEQSLDLLLHQLETAIEQQWATSHKRLFEVAQNDGLDAAEPLLQAYLEGVAAPMIIEGQIRILHIKTVERLNAAISGSERERLDEAAGKVFCPYVYGYDTPIRIASAAQTWPDVTADQKSRLQGALASFTAERSKACGRLSRMYSEVISPESYRSMFRANFISVLIERSDGPRPTLTGFDAFQKAESQWKDKVAAIASDMLGTLTEAQVQRFQAMRAEP